MLQRHTQECWNSQRGLITIERCRCPTCSCEKGESCAVCRARPPARPSKLAGVGDGLRQVVELLAAEMLRSGFLATGTEKSPKGPRHGRLVYGKFRADK